ncbi:MAG: hypothetical protein NC311_19640 [Muribaculaceae bacterium]|nr:hypothetical protein [Muribaculaceae bacterium]
MIGSKCLIFSQIYLIIPESAKRFFESKRDKGTYVAFLASLTFLALFSLRLVFLAYIAFLA